MIRSSKKFLLEGFPMLCMTDQAKVHLLRKHTHFFSFFHLLRFFCRVISPFSPSVRLSQRRGIKKPGSSRVQMQRERRRRDIQRKEARKASLCSCHRRPFSKDKEEEEKPSLLVSLSTRFHSHYSRDTLEASRTDTNWEERKCAGQEEREKM